MKLVTQMELTRLFAKAPPFVQAEFLANLSHELTVSCRAYYVEDSHGIQAPGKILVALNELHHQLSAQIRKLVSGDVNRYPDDILVGILFERIRWARMESLFGNAVRRAIETQPDFVRDKT